MGAVIRINKEVMEESKNIKNMIVIVMMMMMIEKKKENIKKMIEKAKLNQIQCVMVLSLKFMIMVVL